MAEDDWKKRRQREEALEKERLQEDEEAQRIADADKLRLAMDEADSLLDQLTALYNQYAIGVAPAPPVDRRNKLDRKILEIMRAPKATSALTFRWGSLQSAYSTHKERWDRMVRGIESGKIKRVPRK